MANAVVVGFVITKLANILQKEIEILGGVGEKVQQVQSELIRIQCCLIDADSKSNRDEKVKSWLNELCDLAYRIEDAIDMFFLDVEDHRQNEPNILQNLKNPWNKLDTKLVNIHNKLERISKSRVHFGINDIHDTMGEAVTMPLRRATCNVEDETEIASRQADKDNILKLLRPEVTPRRAVITIVGEGGIGKTTLARIVYKSARDDFMYHMMLSISQYNLTNLLRKMLRQLDYIVHENQNERDLINNLKSCLCKGRYFIILDDVLDKDLWDQLKYALPDVNNGSRVLMTSRSLNVAISADCNMAPYKLKLLDSKESLDVLLKKAIPYQESHKEVPRDLFEIANVLSKKCNRLPLALTVIGGILSTKERNYPAWARVSQTLDRHWSEGKSWWQIIVMSYDDMPYHLKACFIYLAIFPEDHEISADCLIRMWVAEGFIPVNRGTTMEEMAEDYLEELFQRSMIHVTSRRMNGSIKCFIVHDLMRELAIRKAHQEKFVEVFERTYRLDWHTRGIRRASLDNYDSRFMRYLGANTRSLLSFRFHSHLPSFSNFRLLKVLEIVGVKICTLDPGRELGKLIHLKYLGLRSWNICINFSSCLFERTKNLETLDIRGTPAVLPNNLWKIHTLRHVLVNDMLSGPNSTADLKNLQTMKWVSPQRTWETELPILSNLRKLGVRKFYNDDIPWVAVTKLLETLPFLLSLCIATRRGDVPFPKEIVYPCALPNYQNLQSLYLDGVWSENVTLEARLFPSNLVKLILINSRLRQNPMPELGKLKSLKKLCFREHDLCYWGPAICLAGFPVLQCLKVGDNILGKLTVAMGVMPKLIDLQAGDRLDLHLPPELQHILRVRR